MTARAAPQRVVHADRYDFIKAWCGSAEVWADGHEMVGDNALAEVTCKACLDAMLELGARAMYRKLDLVEEFIAERKDAALSERAHAEWLIDAEAALRAKAGEP